MRAKTTWLETTIIVGVVITLLIVLAYNQQYIGPQPKGEDNLTQDEVENGVNLQRNGANGFYVVNLIAGSFEGEIEGIVKSDLDCLPDREGISRCKNKIKLDDQSKVTIINPHNMKKNRCLGRNDKVRLSRNEEGKVVIELLTL